MTTVLDDWICRAGARHDRERLDSYRAIRRMLDIRGRERAPDWEELAGRWPELVRPLW